MNPNKGKCLHWSFLPPADPKKSGIGQWPRTLACGLLLLFFSPAVKLPAASPEENAHLFARANQFYEQGKYQEAIQAYGALVSQGVQHQAVYYNLGNAYFKNGRLGLAIVCYERARRLDPSDQDIAENLAFAQARRVDKIEEPETPFWLSGLWWAHHLFPYPQQIWLTILFWAIAHAGWAWWQLRRGETWRRAAIWISSGALLLTLLCGLSAFIKAQQAGKREAIIVVEKSDLVSGPAENNAVLAVIHEGFKVEIRQQADDWCQVVLPNGWNGWIRRSHLEFI